MNLQLMFQFAKERTPDKLAIVDGNLRLTYREWGDRVERFARRLADMGIGKGDTVAICMENSEPGATAFLAIQLLGAVSVPFNFRSKKEGIVYHLKDSEAKMIIFSDLTVATVEEAVPELPAQMLFINTGLKKHPKFISLESLLSTDPKYDGSFPELHRDDPAVILYSSGTTGEPKGIPLSHEVSMYRIFSFTMNYGYLQQNDDKLIGLMPMYHTVGLYGIFLTSVMLNDTYYPVRQFDPLKTLELIETEKITDVAATPTHFQMMLKTEGFNRYDLSSIRQTFYAGAPMSPSLIKECIEKICKNLTLIYGNTETYNNLYMRQTQNHPGMAVSGVFHNVRVVKFGGSHDDMVSPGEEGELIIDMRSPEAFTSYLKKPQQTEKKVKNGWFYTGDAFRLSKEGYFQYCGREDEVIISGGENIHPIEVEDHILSHPGVKDAAIIGLPDERWGQLVKAYIVRKDNGLDADTINRYFKDSSLENYKRPRTYEFIDAIPRNPSGKILRTTLVAMNVEEGNLEN